MDNGGFTIIPEVQFREMFLMYFTEKNLKFDKVIKCMIGDQNIWIFKNPFVFVFRVEKYRPKTLDDLISHKDIISTSKFNFFSHIC